MKSKSKNGKIDDQTAEGIKKSLVQVNGIINCQALISLFINTRKICVSFSGPLPGVPPTLLSPIAFQGATLIPISIKQKSNEINDGFSTNFSVSIDINGPILPHTFYGLMNLFSRISKPICSYFPFDPYGFNLSPPVETQR